MKTRRFNNYLKTLIGLIFLMCSIVIVFNRLIDPFGLFWGPSIEELNTNKPLFSANQRMAKPYIIRRLEPTGIILGSSRAQFGFDPSHPGWNGENIYNFAIPSPNLYEILRHLQHAEAVAPIDTVVLSLDFYLFNANETFNSNAPDFEETRLENSNENILLNFPIYDFIVPEAVFSLSALNASIQTILRQKEPIRFLKNGMHDPYWNSNNIEKRGGVRFFSQEVERGFYKKNLHNYSYISNTQNTWDIYKEILKICYLKNINLKIITSPVHARFLEVISTKGLWQTYNAWLRNLVSINDEMASDLNMSQFPIWSFGYNKYTTESLPLLEDKRTEMLWYWETTHFKKELGDLILDHILNYKTADINDQFSEPLNKDNIGEYLDMLASDRNTWRLQNSKVIDEININLK